MDLNEKTMHSSYFEKIYRTQCVGRYLFFNYLFSPVNSDIMVLCL